MIKFRQKNAKTAIEVIDRADLLKVIGKRKVENQIECIQSGFNNDTGWNEHEIWLNGELVGYTNQSL